MPKPCMLNFDGTVDYYLDPNDYSKKIDGTDSDIGDLTYNGNVMVEFPKIWVKRHEDTNYEYTYIANYKVDNDYYCFSNLDANGNEIDHFYVSAYDGYIADWKLRSISNKSVSTDKKESELVSAAEALNTEDHIWYITQWCDRSLINDLLVLISKSTDTQTSFGMGYVGGTAVKYSGALNNKGLFYGSNKSTIPVKVFGIENYWGNVTKLMHGLMHLYSNSIHKILAKMTWSRADGSPAIGYYYETRTDLLNYYIDTGYYIKSTASSIISETHNAAIFGNLPSTPQPSVTEYNIFDCCSTELSSTVFNQPFLCGSSYNTNKPKTAGAFRFSLKLSQPDSSDSAIGTALSCKPLAQT